MSGQLIVHLRLALIALLAVIAIGGASAMAQTEEVGIEVFYRELEPHGRWTDHPRYGQVWVPDVEQGWRPYTRGQWLNTDEHGWYWESDEPFGWAVYHYGRWYLDERDGWVWVPGSEWGPAWVAWRHSDEEVGWAPLPPEAEWRNGEILLEPGFHDNPRFSPAWCFVPVALLTAPRLYSHVFPARRNAYHLGRTRFVPWQRTATAQFYNSGLDRRRWERLTGRRADVRRVVSVDRPFRDVGGGYRSGDVRVYRPRVVGLPRDDGRPGFKPPVSRRDPADRPDRPRSDRGGRPSFDAPVSRRDPGDRREVEQPIGPRVREGRPSDTPAIDKGGRPGFEPPVSRRDPAERRAIERPAEPRIRDGRSSDAPVVNRGGRPDFQPSVNRRDPGERRADPPREQPRIGTQPTPSRGGGGGPPPQARPADIPNTN